MKAALDWAVILTPLFALVAWLIGWEAAVIGGLLLLCGAYVGSAMDSR